MATEKSMYKWLLKVKGQLIAFSNHTSYAHYSNILETFHIERVENMIGTSTPDVEGCFLGTSFHIELKQCDRPVRKTTNIKIRFEDGQTDWLTDRAKAGGACFILLQVNGKSRKYDSKYLIPGHLAKSIENPVYSVNGMLETNIKEHLSLKIRGNKTPLDYFFEIVYYNILLSSLNKEKIFRDLHEYVS